jgi:hypothetical protein
MMTFETTKSYSLAATGAAAAGTVTAVTVVRLYRAYLKSLPTSGPARPQLVLDAIQNDTPIYYFGVGSNLSRQKLENRSICGSKIHIISMEPCVIHDYRLAFNMRAFPPLEPAMGSLEPLPSAYVNSGNGNHPAEPSSLSSDIDSSASKKRDAEARKKSYKRRESEALKAYERQECHGALIQLSAEDYERVYKSEGGGSGARQGYEEIIITCVPYDESKKPVLAVAFRAREHCRLAKDVCPSKRYMSIIREGAAELGLKHCYQKWLEEHPVQAESSKLFKMVAINSMLFTFTLSMGLQLRVISDVQSNILFKLYVLPTEPKWKQVMGEAAAGIVLLPTACIGFVFKGLLQATGLMPPGLQKWMNGIK